MGSQVLNRKTILQNEQFLSKKGPASEGLVGALPRKLCWKEVNRCKVNLCLRRWCLMNAMHALTYVQ